MSNNKTSTAENLQADIVIIGGGGAGMAAAITAKEKGAKKVILLEKRHITGGNAAFFGGIFGAESVAQKRLGIEARRDELFKKAMDYTHWKTDPRLIRILIDKSGDTIRWLEEKGLRFDMLYPLYPGQTPICFHFCGPAKTGPKLVKVLAKNCEEMGVQILCRCGAKELLTDNKGSVNGVLAATKDKEIRIKAKSVIIATGGFAGNKRLMRKYYPSYNENVLNCGLPFTGDGLLMAAEVGAAKEGLGAFELTGPYFPWSNRLNIVAREATTAWVNKNGERFTDEFVANHFPDAANALNRQPDNICYSLLAGETKKRIVEEGVLGEGLGFYTFLGIKLTLSELENELKIESDKERVKVSNSWDDIAKWIGADPKVLNATVDEYNRFCDQGHDEIFVKDPKYLVPLRTPPYGAIKCCQGVYNTLGGIKINRHMQALNQQDEPIRGLYAAGVDTGGWDYDTYNHTLPGHSIGFSIGTGRIAGENAAKYAVIK